MRTLLLGDIFGRPGREAVAEKIPAFRRREHIDLIIANAENASGGVGITGDSLKELFAKGVDLVTLGNHTYRYKDVYSLLDTDKRIARPANLAPGLPGHGMRILDMEKGYRVAVINLIGRTFMEPAECPFRAADALLAKLEGDVPLIFVDFHAEATSEKKAMAAYLDGRVTAVVGTHTHVQTADASILPGGTAYITDLGMCGMESSVLGMEAESVLPRFLTGLPGRFVPAKGRGVCNGLLVDADPVTGKAMAVSLVREAMAPVVDPGWVSQ